jgi:hypothetical protein
MPRAAAGDKPAAAPKENSMSASDLPARRWARRARLLVAALVLGGLFSALGCGDKAPNTSTEIHKQPVSKRMPK